jgi:hypothetical protein
MLMDSYLPFARLLKDAHNCMLQINIAKAGVNITAAPWPVVTSKSAAFSHRHDAAVTIMMVAIMRVAKMSPSSNARLMAAKSLDAVDMLIPAVLRCSCSRYSGVIIGGS